MSSIYRRALGPDFDRVRVAVQLHDVDLGISLWGDTAEGAPDEERIAELVIVFRSLRRLFYTAKDRCLFDSMVMTRFLHSYGVAHSLVIGVTAEPLTAHSWLQHGGVVLNCDAEIACRFRPILVV